MRAVFLADKQIELKVKMRSLKIYFKDITEQFIRSAGPGGQNVNKVSTCVSLKHLPTGIMVKCQKMRSQVDNRYCALVMLVEKIEKQINQLSFEKQQALAKLKRQNRKKPQSIKLKILENKLRVSEKKKNRQKINLRQNKD